MSPGDVYPKGNAMWPGAGESQADKLIQEVGEGDGEPKVGQAPAEPTCQPTCQHLRGAGR